jgi:hypothetical protein
MCHFAEFLLHAPCLSQLSDDFERFFLQYMQKVAEFVMEVKDPDSRLAKEIEAGNDSAMRRVCR